MDLVKKEYDDVEGDYGERTHAVTPVEVFHKLNNERCLSPDFVQQESDEHIFLKNESGLAEYAPMGLQEVPEDSKNVIDQFIDERGIVWSRGDLLTYCNFHPIKSETDEQSISENQSETKVLLSPKLEAETDSTEQYVDDRAPQNYETGSAKNENKCAVSSVDTKSERASADKARKDHCYTTHVDSGETKLMKHKCHLCDYISTYKGNLAAHFNYVHLKAKIHECHFCDFSASLKSTLQAHIDGVHLKLKTHKCHLCDYSSFQKGNVRKHVDSVHLKLRNYTCHVCGFASSLKSSLRIHIESVHLKLKTHKCRHCDYRSPEKSKIQVHVDFVHLKLKKYFCHLCDFGSSQKRNVQVHVDAVHLKLKNHKCHLCRYSATLKYRLQEHINSVHLKMKKHKCHLCEFGSSKKGYVQKHIETVHSELNDDK